MAFEHLQTVIADGITKNLHTCVQVCVSVDGVRHLDTAFGQATTQTAATTQTIMLWRSAGKPVTAAGILKLAEQGVLSIDDPLQQHLPAATGTVFASMTLKQLLTHDNGLPTLETRWPEADWPQILQGILTTQHQPQDSLAAYQPQATWFLLGEIIRLKSQAKTFAEALRHLVLSPLNMKECDCGLSEDDAVRRRDRLPDLLIRQGSALQSSPLSAGPALHLASPGGNLRGPVSDLVRFYEMLMRRGRLPDGTAYLQESTVDLMTRPHRVDRFDQTLQHKVDMGLGCITSSQHHGPMVPYGFGRFSSNASFGHGGARCSMGFCDPARHLVVAWAANGFCSEPQHQRRNRAINEAIYKDLQLSS